jgi:Uma2 family endonuclease
MDTPRRPGPVLTIAGFQRLPEEDAWRIELVRGRPVREPRPAPLHGRLVARLAHLLYAFAEDASTGVVLADVGVVLARDPDTVRGPDVAFYSHGRIPASGYGGGFWGPPDLAVEVTSPGNSATRIREKVTDYLGTGVRLVWVVAPRPRSVTVQESALAAGLIELAERGGVRWVATKDPR